MANFVPDHIHLLATVFLSGGSPRIDQTFIEGWLERLTINLKMTMLTRPSVQLCQDPPGNEGVTGIVLLNTSHASIHVWDRVKQPYAQVDVYSCKRFKAAAVMSFLIDELKPVAVSYVMVDRNHGNLMIIERNWALRPT